jgi:hypothetical protein
MGTYTEHWQAHMRKTRKDTFVALLILVIGLPATAGIAWLVGRATGGYPVLVHVGLLVAWLVVLTRHLLRSSKVVCPRCATIYAQSKFQLQCPSCGLRILQEEP